MPEHFKSPWKLLDFLKGNAEQHTLSLSWEFRLQLLERISKVLSDLHRKKKAYGFGGLHSKNILLLSSDRYGVRSLENYPATVQKNLDGTGSDLANLDQLCFGVVLLELVMEKPLNGNKLPQIVALLRRKGLGNIKIMQDGKLKSISSAKILTETKEQEAFLKKEMIREDLHRKDFDPQKEMGVADASKYSMKAAFLSRKNQFRKLFGNLLAKGAQIFSKKKDLKKEREITENKVFETFVKQNSSKNGMEVEADVDEFVLSTFVKDEVKSYLNSQETKLEKPTWLINLIELAVSLLTSVDDSRPSSKTTRNWMLEIIQSFKNSKEKHDEVKKAMDDPEFLNLDPDERKKKLEFSATMRKGDYIQHFHMYGLFYISRPIEITLDDLEASESEVLIYHSKDISTETPLQDGYDSDESVQPPTKREEDLEPLERGVEFPDFPSASPKSKSPAKPRAMSVEFLNENNPPPIIGPKGAEMLDNMINQRKLIGNLMKPNEVAKLFDEQQKMPHAELVSMLKKAREIIDAEPNLLSVDAPVFTVGDIHGQYFDLRQVMKFCGRPKRENPSKRAWTSKKHDREEQKKTKSKSFSKGLLSKKKDKRVFNQDEFMKEYEELEDPETELKRNSRNQLSLNQRKKKKKNGNPPPMTKPLTLGRTLGHPEGELETTFSKGVEEEDDKGKVFLFLGDYIDRGSWSCEVLFYLLSMKVHYPDSVIMLRGNHECDTMAETYGFREECEHKYGREVYHRCVQVFSALPIACLVNLPDGKRFLACHGGISDKISTLEQIAEIERRREPGVEGVLCDLLWSDPVPDDVCRAHGVSLPFEKIEFIANETRGCAKKFGYKALETFLKQNELLGIIRAHEAKEEGFQFHFQNAGTRDHICITVFSAPNYMNEHGNKGAVMIIHKSVKDRLLHQMKRLKYKYTVDQVLKQQDNRKDDYLDLLEPICYHEVQQPEVVSYEHENYNKVKQIEDTCPYMPTNIDEFYNSSLDILDRYGDAIKQLETYQKQQEEDAKKITKEIEENQEMKIKIRGDSKKAKFLYESMRLKASSKGIRTVGTLRKSGNNLRSSIKDIQHEKFTKTLKRVKETHPQLMSERIRVASAKLETMDLVKTDDEINLSSGSNVLSHGTLGAMKRNRGLSQGATASDANDLLRADSTLDNQAVIGQLNSRAYMKRERLEIEFRQEWLEVVTLWLSEYASKEFEPDLLCEALADCSILCGIAANVLERDLKYVKPRANEKLSPLDARRNLIVFQDACKELGVLRMFVMFDLNNGQINYVLPPLIDLSRKAYDKGKLNLGLGVDIPHHLFQSGEDERGNDLMGDLKKDLEVGKVSFDGEERLMLQLLFLMIDLNDSGFITSEAIITWAREENKLIRPNHAARVISAIDYDNDGKIGLRDFFLYAATLKEEFLRDEFEEYDEYETADEDEETFFNGKNLVAEVDNVFDPKAAVDLNNVDLSDEDFFDAN